MEHEGIFYFFRHEDGKHTMVLANAASSYADCPESPVEYSPGSLAPNHVQSWEHHYEFRSGKWSQTDYNFETPSTSLLTTTSTVIDLPDAPKYEIFDYPGEYFVKGDGDPVTKVRMEEEEAGYNVVNAASQCCTFTPCGKFTLEEHDVAARERRLRDHLDPPLGHRGQLRIDRERGLRTTTSSPAFPASVIFRPARATPKPMVQGVQTAVVTGPGGEEIYVDKYGRVKVQFFWDRKGKKDEKSSCWIRVAEQWAGKNWGFVCNPRIGQEVIVDFLEGDPDRPLITGRVYNAEQMPPYDLPGEHDAERHQVAEQQGGLAGQLQRAPLRGQEGLGAGHAPRREGPVDRGRARRVAHWVGHDRTKTIDHDETTHVKHDRTETVDNNETITIHGNRTETVDKDETITIHMNRTETVDKNETITVSQNRTRMVDAQRDRDGGVAQAITVGAARAVTVGAAQTITVGAAQMITVGAAQAITRGGSETESYGGNHTQTVGGNQSVTVAKDGTYKIVGGRATDVGKDDTLKVAKKLRIDAGEEIMHQDRRRQHYDEEGRHDHDQGKGYHDRRLRGDRRQGRQGHDAQGSEDPPELNHREVEQRNNGPGFEEMTPENGAGKTIRRVSLGGASRLRWRRSLLEHQLGGGSSVRSRPAGGSRGTRPTGAARATGRRSKRQVPLPGEFVVGNLAGINDSGQPLVRHPLDPSGRLILARSTVPVSAELVGREVVIAFESGDIERPIILGTLGGQTTQLRPGLQSRRRP